MNSKERILQYLEKYEDLWQVHEGDIDMTIIDDKPDDWYGWNLTGKYRMIMLFFKTSNYFPGIWIGENEHNDDLEKCPIYLCDIASDEEPIYVGNFKAYMLDAIKRLKELTEDEFNEEQVSEDYNYAKYWEKICNAETDINSFSDDIISYDVPITRSILEGHQIIQ